LKFICDPGSCHLGDITLARDLVKVAADAGADAVKFQLFPKEMEKNGNIRLKYMYMPELVDYGNEKGIEVFASVWDLDGMFQLMECGCQSIKFAYSMRESLLLQVDCLRLFKNIYMSGDVMTNFPDLKGLIKLYCIPEYPVKYQADFEGIFPRFKGFSSHTLGIKQDIEAIRHGAEIIEKHIRLYDYQCDNVPDGKFALAPDKLTKLISHAKQITK